MAIQFLDCVHQLWCQHVLEFEFNLDLLGFLAYHMYSGAFGNLLYRNPRERLEKSCATKTLSCWSYVMANKINYTNPLFEPQKKLIHGKYKERQLRVWREYFSILDDNLKRSHGTNGAANLDYPILDRSVNYFQPGLAA